MLFKQQHAAGLLALFVGSAKAQSYVPSVTFDGSNFFSTWNFFNGPDPTYGFVEYVDGATAATAGLANVDPNGNIFMGVDSYTMSPPNGRRSVRLESQQQFTHGLFLADIAHMPGSVCGTWPAWWMFGPGWPSSGEIDIIEGVNSQTSNIMTLHTSGGCSMTSDGVAGGTQAGNPDCNAGNANEGCGQSSSDNQNYGDGFNAIGGGVYATEWTSDHIATWFFPRNAIPSDISSDAPNPGNWGAPLSKFNGGSGCNIDDHFKNHNLIFDTTFCGGWAGNVWASNPECSALAPTCEQYVGNNPEAFKEAYWTVNSVKVFNAV